MTFFLNKTKAVEDLGRNRRNPHKRVLYVGQYIHLTAALKQKDLLPLTGYVHGGCSPIGMKKQFRTTVDESARAFDSIIFSGGRIGLQVQVALRDLSEMVPFQFADVTTGLIHN